MHSLADQFEDDHGGITFADAGMPDEIYMSPDEVMQMERDLAERSDESDALDRLLNDLDPDHLRARSMLTEVLQAHRDNFYVRRGLPQYSKQVRQALRKLIKHECQTFGEKRRILRAMRDVQSDVAKRFQTIADSDWLNDHATPATEQLARDEEDGPELSARTRPDVYDVW